MHNRCEIDQILNMVEVLQTKYSTWLLVGCKLKTVLFLRSLLKDFETIGPGKASYMAYFHVSLISH
jgi:hypothetical protein